MKLKEALMMMGHDPHHVWGDEGPVQEAEKKDKKDAKDLIDKDEAQYRTKNHRDELLGRRCGTCKMFRPPHECTLVKGEIESKGICRYWESKAKE